MSPDPTIALIFVITGTATISTLHSGDNSYLCFECMTVVLLFIKRHERHKMLFLSIDVDGASAIRWWDAKTAVPAKYTYCGMASKK